MDTLAQPFAQIMMLINTTMIGFLLFHMKAAASQRAVRDGEMRDAMGHIVTDLKTLNDAVLGEYATRTVVENLVESLRAEHKETKAEHRRAMHGIRDELHHLELAMTKYGISIPMRPLPDG